MQNKIHWGKIKAIAFDLDGTLYSSSIMIANTYLVVIKQLQEKYHLSFPLPTIQKIIASIGNPGKWIYESLVPKEAYQYSDEFGKMIKKSLQQAIENKQSHLYPGVLELLEFLYSRSIQIFIASNGAFKYVVEVINNTGIDKYIKHPIINLDYTQIMVKADILEKYLLDNILEPDNLIMVGDRASDIEAAHANNIFSIGLKSGIGYNINPKELEQADLIVKDLPALLELIQNNL